jgi:hypothetical protein
MAAQKLKVLIAVVAAMVLILATGVAFAGNNAPDTSTGGNNSSQVGGDENDNEAGETEDADEPGDVDGPGDTED